MQSPVSRSVFVSSPCPVHLIIDNKYEGVTARVVESGQNGENASFKQFEREITLTFSPEILDQERRMELSISSPKFPNFQLHVPIFIMGKAPVRPDREGPKE